MATVYHLGLAKEQIKNASYAFLPGDPFRCPIIAQKLDKNYGEISWKREYRSCLGELSGVKVLVTSTGIGGSSTSIAIDELASLGIKTFIRIGTTGSIQKRIKAGDVIITTGAVRLDGTSTHYAPIEYPAVADFEITSALVEAAENLRIKYHLGITASSATFYPGQERYDSFSKYVIKKFQGSLKEWQRLNVLNYEMESSTLLTMCSALGLKAGSIAGVVVERTKEENIERKVVKKAEKNAVRVAIKGMQLLILKL